MRSLPIPHWILASSRKEFGPSMRSTNAKGAISHSLCFGSCVVIEAMSDRVGLLKIISTVKYRPSVRATATSPIAATESPPSQKKLSSNLMLGGLIFKTSAQRACSCCSMGDNGDSWVDLEELFAATENLANCDIGSSAAMHRSLCRSALPETDIGTRRKGM